MLSEASPHPEGSILMAPQPLSAQRRKGGTLLPAVRPLAPAPRV